MSINHFSSSSTEAHHWWSHYSPPPPPQTLSDSPAPAATFWLTSSSAPMNNQDEDETPKERLFEKPLTPSDVGKLNRLVIPKQHAEKHFPLNAATTDSGENGLLLGFEDEVGKAWRFRYSYWNSSQSYVLTKGWSRFVKEKRLDAGDIVMFARHRLDSGRLFIGWRRRHETSHPPAPAPAPNWGTLYYSAGPTSNYQPAESTSSLHAAAAAAGGGGGNLETTSSCGNSKTLRLFGVNLECGHATDDSEPSTPVGSPISSTHLHPYYSSNANHHMDISFSGGGADVYRQG